MLEPDLMELFVKPLDQLQIRYLISISVAAMFCGESRFTNDIDLIVFLRAPDAERMVTGYPTPESYLPLASVIAAEIGRERGQRHLRDIRPMLAVSGELIDYGALRERIRRWRVWEKWE